MGKTDRNYVLRQLPFIAGGIGGTLLLINRLTTVDLTPSQARSDVAGVILSAVLILIGLIWQQIQPRSPDAVELIGEQKLEFASDLPDLIKTELAWASHLLLTNTVTKTLVIYYQGNVLLRRGIFSNQEPVEPGRFCNGH